MGETPKIHIDSDWKAQAQAEKAKLAQQESKPRSGAGVTGGGPAGAAGREPQSPFEILLSTMATQALFAMGAIPDPRTGQRVAHLDLARHHIDMLAVIEEKTKGNLTPDEGKLLTGMLYELRSRYIQIANSARAQGAGGGAGVGPTI